MNSYEIQLKQSNNKSFVLDCFTVLSERGESQYIVVAVWSTSNYLPRFSNIVLNMFLHAFLTKKYRLENARHTHVTAIFMSPVMFPKASTHTPIFGRIGGSHNSLPTYPMKHV